MSSSLSVWQRIRRTPYQAIATMSMMFITLLVIGLFLLLIAGSSAILSYFESKPQLTVFLKDEKSKTDVDRLTEKLKSTGKVATYQYISKDQALAIYREQNKNDPLLLEMVTADILPASLDVSATSPKYLSELAEMIKQEEGVDEVVFQKDVVDTLLSWTSTVRKIGFIFVVFLLISTFLILLTSTGMKIALKREEIEILKLVGATSWYIKKPFIKEGLMYAVFSSIFAFLTIVILLFYSQPFVSAFLQGIPNLSVFSWDSFNLNIWPFNAGLLLLLLLLILGCGLVIGLLGSLIAVSRYMKY